MSRKAQALFFTFGAALFVFLVRRVGVHHLLANAVRIGWLIVPVAGVYALVYAGNAWAWAVIMGGEPRRPPLWRTYAFTIAGFSINSVTPMANAGGEPFKVAAVSGWLGTRRATGSVVLYVMVHALGHLLMWMTALLLALTFVHSSVPRGVTIAVAVVCVGLALFLLSRHRRGFLEKLLDLLLRVPLLGGWAGRLEPRRETLVRLDAQITAFYHERPGRFYQALGLEYLSRCVSVLEYSLIAMGVGLSLSYAQALVIGAFTSMITNVLFLVPMEVGTKEGGMYAVFAALGLNPAIGLYVAIVSRVREIAWIAIGLGLVWLAGPSGHGTPAGIGVGSSERETLMAVGPGSGEAGS